MEKPAINVERATPGQGRERHDNRPEKTTGLEESLTFTAAAVTKSLTLKLSGV